MTAEKDKILTVSGNAINQEFDNRIRNFTVLL